MTSETYRSELRRQRELLETTWSALDRRDLTKDSLDLRAFVYADAARTARKFVKAARSVLGGQYEVALSEGVDDAREEWVIRCGMSLDEPTIESLDLWIQTMLHIATTHGCDFDGWEVEA